MNQTYTAVVNQDGPWWIGWIEEVPGVNCREHTKDELVSSLRITLVEALEMNREEARNAAGAGYEKLNLAVWKRRDLLRPLSEHGCSLLREDGRHSWWHNPGNRRSTVPRHSEIKRSAGEEDLQGTWSASVMTWPNWSFQRTAVDAR